MKARILSLFMLLAGWPMSHGLCPMAFAQQAWTLQDCIDYAQQHNIQVQKNRISEERSEVTLWQNKGALFPSLSFTTGHNVGYRPFTESTSVVQGDQVTSTRSNVTYQGSYGLNANVTLWNGGINYKNIEAQKLQNRIASLTTEQSELTIQEQIAQLYVQIMYTKEAKKVNEQLLGTAQSQYDRGVEMMKQGQMARADVVQLEAQLSSAQYAVVNSETQLANYKRQLKALLELDLDTPFDVAGNLPTDEQVLALVPNAQEAYAKALEMRPEIKSAELSIEAADMQLNIAKRGYLPTIGASASLGSNHTSGNKNGWGEQMKTNLNMSAGLNLSVPIFDSRRNATNVKTAKLQQLTSKLDLQDRKNTLSSTIEQYWLNANSGQQNYIAAKTRVKSQEASYELINEQFQNGLKSTVDVLQGRDNVISAEQDMLQSKYMALLNIQLLKFYTGEKIEL
ncbi:MAG: TolC family protein [Prevotellaceae bacterium]|nr:TolC family protein [Prevotellaceae bacterium]